MKGFKSFADPTVLEFEPGITVVVGPNGSGKSNVVDAVTWVLGAQGPRSLRSQKMEDVIFAGTSSRAALGRAEVSLTIDNGSGKLALDMAEVTITRTLFRTGDSEYAINGSPCRLLDIQDLLSDSGVGRQQHMIIGQGQLDTVLNARPEDRRSIIEEAAGVLKHRRRRERAERRLVATAENLERLGDLVREVQRQIRPLERQAAAARTFTSLADELQAIRCYLAGSELTELQARRQVVSAQLGDLKKNEGELQESLDSLDAAASETAAELSSRREEDLASALGKVQGLVERSRGTALVLHERARALSVALDAAADVDVVSTLEAEAARLSEELLATEAEMVAFGPERAEIDGLEEALLTDVALHEENWGDGSYLVKAEEDLSLTRNRRELVLQSLERDKTVLDETIHRIQALKNRAEKLEKTSNEMSAHALELETLGRRLTQEATIADEASKALSKQLEETQLDAAKADEVRHRSAARAEALGRALEELEGASGRELLDGVDGVVGALVELIEIDLGWEAAFEAAVGAAVASVVVEGRDAAQEALERLRTQGVTGSVLAVGDRVSRGSVFESIEQSRDLGSNVEALRAHVRGRGTDGIESVLDALVGHALCTSSWEEAIDLSLRRPDLVVVTREGDRFAASGWRVRSSSQVVTRSALKEAEQKAVEAEQEAQSAHERLTLVRQRLEEARHAVAGAARAVDRNESNLTTVLADIRRNEQDQLRLGEELLASEHVLSEIQGRIGEANSTLDELNKTLGDLEELVAELRVRAQESGQRFQELEKRRVELNEARQRFEVRIAGVQERQKVLSERRAEVERRLEGHVDEREQAAARRRRLESEGRALSSLEVLVKEEHSRLEEVLAQLRSDYRDQIEAVKAGGQKLEELRHSRHTLEQRLGVARDKARVLELEEAEVKLRIDALIESIHRDLHSEPSEVMSAPCPDLANDVDPIDHANKLADKLSSLGPVNPLALEELAALEDRHKDLDSQVDDVRTARRELQEVVRSLDEEIMESFAAAAADVNEHFSSLVAMLFPGGVGRLVLTDPDDLLNTGVEIEVRPAGRNVRRVSLLSGGERSMAALAFLFAVFRSRPSPFYLMDEVEAALDDVNLHRFLGLVKEFRDEAQLIIVSHQKRTMETGDALYGVTMAPGGSSQVVSQKVASEVTGAASR